MAIEGSLQHFHLPEILQMISAQGKTGILTVQGENDIVAISFNEGDVVAADALNQTVEEGLGQVLASQGLVSPADFSSVTEEHEAGGERLLDILVDRGFIDRRQLLDALRLQTYQLLLQLLRWDQGEFKFYSGDEVAFEEGFRAISVEELLIRSVEDLGEDARGGQLPSLDVVYEATRGPTPIKVIGEDGTGPLDDSSALWLGAEERVLVDQLDGDRTAGEIAEESGLGEYKVLYTLYRLLSAGAVRPAASSAPPAAPSAVPDLSPPAPDRPGALEERVAEPDAQGEVVSFEPALDVEMPEPGEMEEEATTERPPSVGFDIPEGWSVVFVRTVALVVGLVVAGAALQSPRRAALGLPWQQAGQEALVKTQRTARFQRIDRAARTFFLLEGHYPDDLSELVGLGLLPERVLEDPAGYPLAYTTDDVSYVLQPIAGGVAREDLVSREGITGDFLLDPEFLDLPKGSERPPLVLLD